MNEATIELFDLFKRNCQSNYPGVVLLPNWTMRYSLLKFEAFSAKDFSFALLNMEFKHCGKKHSERRTENEGRGHGDEGSTHLLHN